MKMPSDFANESAHVITVTIEIPRGSFVKYAMDEDGGKVDFISPLPCPFNYGFVKGTTGGDGMPLDAIVLGSRIQRGEQVTMSIRGLVKFIDNGSQDDKIVCSKRDLTAFEILLLQVGFPIYAIMKRTVNFWRGKRGKTCSFGLHQDSETISSVFDV